jgi:exosortase/archaeosortase family protein
MVRAGQFIIKSAKRLALKPGLRFGLAMGACLLMLVVFQHSPGAIRALAPLDGFTAGITAAVLHLSGMPVHREAGVLSYPAGFSYHIGYKCTGLIAAGFLSAGLLVLPGRWRARLLQVLLGAALVLALNVVRLVSLFYIGVSYPQMFGLFHTVLWNAGMLVFMLGFWLQALRRHGV